jgi:two-component system chemotaxis response regulator CheB
VRVLIIDDSAFIRKALSQFIGADPAFEIVGVARNGQEGLEKAKLLRPDVITLDVEMPVMDGMATLARILAECRVHRPAVLMCSTKTVAGCSLTLEAMKLGAADFITKDIAATVLGAEEFQRELIAKLKAIGERVVRRSAGEPPPPTGATSPSGTAQNIPPHLGKRDLGLVVIGSSTGGPPVLETILSSLPGDYPLPVLVAQHMPLIFTQSMAERFASRCKVKVVHAADGEVARPGCVMIAPGGRHLRVHAARGARGGVLRVEVSDEPASALYKPSVNELFASAALATGARTLGVVLTGMGDDGMLGAKEIHREGGVVLAQDAASCVVYGMPRAVTQAGVASASLSPLGLVQSLRSVASPASGRSAHAA